MENTNTDINKYLVQKYLLKMRQKKKKKNK